MSGELDDARVRTGEAHRDSQRRRFARPVGAEEPEDGAVRHLQRHVVEDDMVAVGLADAVEGDGRGGGVGCGGCVVSVEQVRAGPITVTSPCSTPFPPHGEEDDRPDAVGQEDDEHPDRLGQVPGLFFRGASQHDERGDDERHLHGEQHREGDMQALGEIPEFVEAVHSAT